MRPTRALSRRSFLARVAGRAAVAGALAMLAGDAESFQLTDCDRGPGADPGGRGTGRRPRTGVTDNDSGAAADPGGCGRGGRSQAGPSGGQRQTGLTDRDPTDRAGYGTGGNNSRPYTGVTDSDSGTYADPAGSGRGAVGTTSRCGGDRARMEEINRELSAFPYMRDEDIAGASADLAHMQALDAEITRLANDLSQFEDLSARDLRIDMLRQQIHLRGSRWTDVCHWRETRCAIHGLDRRIVAAQEARGARDALVQEYTMLHERYLRVCT